MNKATYLAILCAVVISGGFLFFQNSNDAEADLRQEYREYVNRELSQHKFAPGKSGREKITPQGAWQQNFLMTMDPALKRPTPERLIEVRNRVKAATSGKFKVPGESSSPWAERGPDNVGGRTRALMWDPNDTAKKKVWAGGVTGGLWYNNDITSSTSEWKAVNDFWDNIAISSLTHDPNNTQVFYAGTGEGWGTGSSRGEGIWKSTNGGTSWAQLSATANFHYVNDIIMRNESGQSVLYAAVSRKHYQGQFNGDQGLYRSTNGGSSFTQVLPSVNGNPYSPGDIELGADNRIWIGSTDNSFGDGGGTILYSDSGISGSWTVAKQTPNGDRVELATAPSDANYVYAIVESEGKVEEITYTADKGSSWTAATEPEDADNGIPATDFSRGQAWYDLILAVDPNNKDKIYAGAIDLFTSSDKGATWTQLSKWSNNPNLNTLNISLVHADQHQIAFKPGSTKEVIFGTDGGVYYSNDITASGSSTIVSRNNNYNVTQFYSAAMHPTAGKNQYLAGSQDNGTQRFVNAGLNTTSEATGGDGAYTFIDQTDPKYQLTSYVYNSWYKSTNEGVSFQRIQNDDATGLFINPADYDNNLDILYSSRTETTVQRIKNISGSIGSETIDFITISSLGGKASNIKVSPYTTSSSTIFVSTTGGKVFRVTNADGNSPAATEITGSNFPAGWVSSIELGSNEKEIIVTFSNYGVISVWYSSDSGQSWISKEGDLPDMPVRWSLMNPGNADEVILATELGVWSTSNFSSTSPNWTSSTSGLANVRVDMLQTRSSDNQVAAATYGRGLFTSSFVGSGSSGNLTVTLSSMDYRLTNLPLPDFPRFYATLDIAESNVPPSPVLKLSNFKVKEDGLAVDMRTCKLTPPSAGGSRLADIVFIVDNSGSMGFEQQDVIDNIIAFVQELESRGVDFALGLTRYGQSGIGSLGITSGGPIFEDNGTLTTDANYFKNSVLSKNTTNGSNEPGYLSIKESVANFSFRPGSQKIFIIATDETPNQGSSVTEQQAIDALTLNDVTLYASTTSGLTTIFQKLTDPSNGKVFDIQADFSTTVADAITNQVSNSYILSCISPTLFDGTDATSGSRQVSIEVTGGSGSKVTKTASYDPSSKSILNLSNNSLTKRNQSQPLNQNLSIEAEIKFFKSTNISSAEIFYRKSGSTDPYQKVAMSKGSDSPKANRWQFKSKIAENTTNYTGAIPAADVKEPGMEFYIRIRDLTSTVTIPSTDPQSKAFNYAVGSNAPPQITHTPPTSIKAGSPLLVKADVTDNTSGVGAVNIFYRVAGDITYKKQQMTSSGGSSYQYEIPSTEVTSLGIEYYIEAEDTPHGIVNTSATPDFPYNPGSEVLLPPKKPINLTFELSDKFSSLTWKAPEDKDLLLYKIYRGPDPSNLGVLDSVEVGNLTYVDSNFNASTLFYTVSAVDSSDNESPLSNIVGHVNKYEKINSDWKLISAPIIESFELTVPSDVQMYGFSGTYKASSALRGGSKAYWIKGGSTDSLQFKGKGLTQTPVTLQKGWNLIGGIADTISTSSIVDSADILGSTSIFEYKENAYADATELKPGQGYWIFANEEGKIDLRLDDDISLTAASNPDDQHSKQKEELVTISFEHQRSIQTLFIADDELNSDKRNSFLLPPTAPNAVLDIRTTDGLKLIDRQNAELLLMSQHYPIKVSLGENAHNHWRLEVHDGKDVVYYDLSAGQAEYLPKAYDKLYLKKLAGEDRVVQNALFQNYPNPFNPSTTIKYQLSNKTNVQMEVFDVIGRKVLTLVNNQQQAGIYTVNFDASRLSSGMYFIRFKAGSFHQIQKISLIK
jgi:hypothetical protein